MSAVPTIPELLDRAASVIRDRGLHKGGFFPRGANPQTCPVCTVGAVNVAAFGIPEGTLGLRRIDTRALHLEQIRCKAVDVLAAHIGGLRDGLDVAPWSDAPDRTPDEVIAALRGAAHSYRTEAAR